MPTALAPSITAEPKLIARSFTSAVDARNHVKDLVRSVGRDPDTIAIDGLFGELLEHGSGNILVIDPGLNLALTVARFRWVSRR